ncbi:hypothetical protein TELCIR_17631 [Teladorsagia circumcincta]|uniref:Glycoside hydrolase family 19 catalytic domain-containing protein n=1 Tax=Teladorsagia circumcincta TaxID=45464 RepID=A0A2G9TS92_TELCI|nr:hypothetical protein TELCIR_17631 [Teladorsagia circumcincta]
MDPPLAMLASLWFYMTPQPPKPSMHSIVVDLAANAMNLGKKIYKGSSHQALVPSNKACPDDNFGD